MTLTIEQYKEKDHLYDTSVINAEIVADSLSPVRNGTRLTTYLLTIPQIIHPELLRHRAFSFAVSSNRAVPVKRVLNNMNFRPVWRYRAKAGMQPGSFVEEGFTDFGESWEYLRGVTERVVQRLDENGAAKELANRPLTAFQTINILVSSSSFNNFFTLRNHPDAQFEIQVLARRMMEKYENSTPRYLMKGEWHLPFILDNERNNPLHEQMAVSVARCARTSYKMPDRDVVSEFSKDVELFKKLITPPLHASPLEFVATPMTLYDIYETELPPGISSEWYGNTYGWVQLRKFFDKTYYTPSTLNFTEVENLRKLLG